MNNPQVVSLGTVEVSDYHPIGSMYGTYANIWDILMVNVTIYTVYIPYMDPMGTDSRSFEATQPRSTKIHQHFRFDPPRGARARPQVELPRLGLSFTADSAEGGGGLRCDQHGGLKVRRVGDGWDLGNFWMDNDR